MAETKRRNGNGMFEMEENNIRLSPNRRQQDAIKAGGGGGNGGSGGGKNVKVEQYHLLKSRLEKLGYKDVLPIDGMSLVLKLLNDLVQTTDSCRKLKLENDGIAQERQRFDVRVEPLKQEIEQLTKENNLLHVHIIKAADERDEKEKKSQLALHKYRNEVADLQFVNRQLMARFDSEQRTSDAERMRLGQVLDLMGVNVGREIDSKYLRQAVGSKLAHKETHFQFGQPLDLLEQPSRKFPAPELHSVDLMKLADANIANVRKELQDSQIEVKELSQQIEFLSEQIRTRDIEIARLGTQLESERLNLPGPFPTDESSGMPAYVTGTRMEHLENQLQYLSDSMIDLEKEKANLEKEKAMLHADSQEKISGLTQELETMIRRNEELCRDLKTLEKLIGEYEAMPRPPTTRGAKKGDQNNRKPSNPSRVADIYDQLTKAKRDIVVKSNIISRHEAEIKRLKEEHSKTEQELHSSKQELLLALKGFNSEAAQKEQSSAPKSSDVVESLNHAINTSKSRIQRLKQENEEQKNRIIELEAQRNQMAADMDHSKTQLHQQAQEVNELRSHLRALEEDAKKLSAERDELSNLVQEMNMEVPDDQKEGSGVVMQDEEESSLESERQRLIDENEHLKRQISILQISSDSLSDTHLTTSEKIGGNRVETSQQAYPQAPAVSEDAGLLREEIVNLRARVQELLSKNQELLNSGNGDVLRKIVEEFDQERDALFEDIDRKDQAVADLENQLRLLKITREDRQSSEEIYRQNSHHADERIAELEREVLNLRALLERARNEKGTIQLRLDAELDKQEVLAKEKAAFQAEIQRLSDVYDRLSAEKESVEENRNAQQRQLEYLEQIIETKNNERDQIMATYRKLLDENAVNVSNLKNLEQEIQQLNTRLAVKGKECDSLDSALKDSRSQVETQMKDLETSRLKVSDLTSHNAVLQQQIERHNTKLDHLNGEISRLRESLYHAQTVSDQKASDKTELVSKLREKDVLVESLGQREQALMAELKSERDKTSQLEQLVSDERQKHIKADLVSREAIQNSKIAQTEVDALHRERMEHGDTVAALSTKLLAAENEKTALLHKISQLEVQKSERDHVVTIDREVPAMSPRKTPAAVIESSTAGSLEHESSYLQQSPPSEFEKRLTTELRATKSQLKKYEDMIASKHFVHMRETEQKLDTMMEEQLQRGPQVPGNKADDVAKELLRTWKLQNEAIRKELLHLQSLQTPVTSTPLVMPSQVPTPPPKLVQDKVKEQRDMAIEDIVPTNQPETKAQRPQGLFQRADNDADSGRQRRLEEENRKLLSVVAQVREQLKNP